jgi:RNA polymerase sigma-70 factor (ECF subfamily)
MCIGREGSHGTLQGVSGALGSVIELPYFHGMTQTEIAARVGPPIGTVKDRQRLALTKMHRQLVRGNAADAQSRSRVASGVAG